MKTVLAVTILIFNAWGFAFCCCNSGMMPSQTTAQTDDTMPACHGTPQSQPSCHAKAASTAETSLQNPFCECDNHLSTTGVSALSVATYEISVPVISAGPVPPFARWTAPFQIDQRALQALWLTTPRPPPDPAFLSRFII